MVVKNRNIRGRLIRREKTREVFRNLPHRRRKKW